MSNVELSHILLLFSFYRILFFDYCVLPLHVYGCAWQLLINKYDDGDDDDEILGHDALNSISTGPPNLS